MQIIVFEDEKVPGFAPLVDLKPVYDLVTGCRTLRERFVDLFDGARRPGWHVRRHLEKWFRESSSGDLVNTICEDELLLVNGRLFCDRQVRELIEGDQIAAGEALLQNGALLFCRINASQLPFAGKEMPDIIDGRVLSEICSRIEVSGFTLLEHLWDTVALHPQMMQNDRRSMVFGRIEGQVHASAILVNPDAITIERDAVVMAGVVLDASDGFIHIGAGAVVEPVALLMQSVFIAPGARVKSGARIYSNVFVGTGSKCGGEIEDSIVESFANKQHDGFLGHSYISHWCNIGAGTDTSDLKNNYSAVNLMTPSGAMRTGQKFLGLFMGEHSKCAIGTRFNTGTIVGTSANIFGEGMPSKYVPSFCWGDGKVDSIDYEADKALETARKVMARRQIVMTRAYEEMFLKVAAGG